MQSARRIVPRPIVIVGLIVALMGLGSPRTQGSTFPGENGLIVFESNLNGDQEIYTMNPDGPGVTQLTDTAGENRAPTWSADGTKIAFYSTRDGAEDIYVMDADGSGQTRLTFDPGSDGSPSWSFDGTKIAFVSNRVTAGNPTGDGEVFVMDADGSNVTQLTSNELPEGNVSYSPDGTKIAFDRDVHGPSEIWVMDAGGGNQTKLTESSGTQDVEPNWSPDGTKIVWRRDFGGCSSADIWVMNSDGSSQAPLVCATAHDSGPAFSPDGTMLVFSAFRDGQHEIYVANADGTGQTRILASPSTDFGPDWQPIPQYNFDGFFPPVSNPPMFNTVKAGAGVPVKFSLDGFQGSDIFAANYPRSTRIDCDSQVPQDDIEETITAGSSSLSYDPETDQYTYVWKTDKAWKNTCRELNVRLDDGTDHLANFMFQ